MKTPCLKALALGLAALNAAPALAETRHCAAHTVIVERLAERWGETRQSMGLAANNAVIEVFASEATGTWTITATMPGGPTCLIASGEAFQALSEALPNFDSPA